MAGLSRFDCYPRDWFLDTRMLSLEARGAYLDIVLCMYASGEPVPYHEGEQSETDLCNMLALRRRRTLRRVLAELIGYGKLRIENGALVNGRTMEELAAARKRRQDREESLDNRPRSGREVAEKWPRSGREVAGSGIENSQNQHVAPPRARVPSPSPSEEDEGCSARAREVIALFDAVRVSVFGPTLARAWPYQTDLAVARRWLEAGADAGLLRSAFEARFRQQAAARDPPSNTLKHMGHAVADALRARLAPMPEGRVNGNGGCGNGRDRGATGFAAVIAERWGGDSGEMALDAGAAGGGPDGDRRRQG